MMGTLAGIAYKTEKRAPMITCESAFIGLKTGVADDFRGLPGKRQVTVMSEEAFQEACDELKMNLPWTIRRANLLLKGVQLQNTSGMLLKIGPVTLEITGETDPCYRMDEQAEGLKEALESNWRGGVTCRVTTEGNVKLGDEVQLVKP